MKINKLIKMALSGFVFVCVLLLLVIFFYFYWEDLVFNPDPVGIEVFPGKDNIFSFNVSKKCIHEIGLLFTDESESDESIKQLFGEKLSELNLPAVINVRLLNLDGVIVFERKGFGGKGLGYRYGPDPVKFVAGKAVLLSGKYEVIVNIESVRKDFNDVGSYFFAQHIPKTKCSK